MNILGATTMHLWWLVSLIVAVRGSINSAGGGTDDPVLAGYDLVAYHSLRPYEDGVVGSAEYSHRHTDGYLYYFSSQENLDLFRANPSRYLPQYGGFCAWGMAWEYPEDGWPWAADHMGPPCGPRDGWALLEVDGETRLYCSIWRSYQDDFNRKQVEGIRLANKRWIEFYGSLDAGPKNNGCYAWNWQECFAQSIYDPEHPVTASAPLPPTEPAEMTTSVPNDPLFDDDEGIEIDWSEEQDVMEGTVTFKWSLQNITSVRPALIVELTYNLNEEEISYSSFENFYLGFGVAEQLMEGPLVVCYPEQQTQDITSICKTFIGSGMGIYKPQVDPVQPTVISSDLSDGQYRVQFTANLFACWSNPFWPARLLFSRGSVSGNGDPMPHINSAQHRQAIPGVDLLSVLRYSENHTLGSAATTSSPPPPAKTLQPLPNAPVSPVPKTAGSLEILEGRVTISYEIFAYGDKQEEVVHVQLQNVEFDMDGEENQYIGFGFAADTMSGLIMTCSPRFDQNTEETSAVCHQWRGRGTNLYPLDLVNDAGGWILDDIVTDGRYVNLTIIGRMMDVMSVESPVPVRAICALGRAASGMPLIHTSRDRTSMILDQLTNAFATVTTQTRVENEYLSGAPHTVSTSWRMLTYAATVMAMVLIAA
mmetsp:Transcript_19331/g.34780  ORF Transcript_19331/g.34780 Transcript_19331/m.34780 type:complete len:649 (-) Transcript_19331:324-2270(-)